MDIFTQVDKIVSDLMNIKAGFDYYGMNSELPVILYHTTKKSFYGFGRGVSLVVSYNRDTTEVLYHVNFGGKLGDGYLFLSGALKQYNKLEKICKIESGIKACKICLKDGQINKGLSSIQDKIIKRAINTIKGI